VSRTDKDIPYRIRVLRTEEPRYADHGHHLIGRSMRFPSGWGHYTDEITFTGCDLDNEPTREDSYRACEWHLAHWAYSWYEHPGVKERRNSWHKPDRSATRMGLRELNRSFTGSEDLDGLDDDHVRVFQHRGSAALGGGYWD
jgi:hypothetical protein